MASRCFRIKVIALFSCIETNASLISVMIFSFSLSHATKHQRRSEIAGTPAILVEQEGIKKF